MTHTNYFNERRKISSEFFTSELLVNPEEIHPRYYMEGDVTNLSKSSITHWRVTRREQNETFFNSINPIFMLRIALLPWKELIYQIF